jgi:hypothetical protein
MGRVRIRTVQLWCNISISTKDIKCTYNGVVHAWVGQIRFSSPLLITPLKRAGARSAKRAPSGSAFCSRFSALHPWQL